MNKKALGALGWGLIFVIAVVLVASSIFFITNFTETKKESTNKGFLINAAPMEGVIADLTPREFYLSYEKKENEPYYQKQISDSHFMSEIKNYFESDNSLNQKIDYYKKFLASGNTDLVKYGKEYFEDLLKDDLSVEDSNNIKFILSEVARYMRWKVEDYCSQQIQFNKEMNFSSMTVAQCIKLANSTGL